MEKELYFSKIEFIEKLGYKDRFTLLINLDEKKIYYEEYRTKRNMPSGVIIETDYWEGEPIESYTTSAATRIMRNGKTNFQPHHVRINSSEDEVVVSHGIELSSEDIKELLPYCKVMDFEPYRNKFMSMDDPGFIGYRDEVSLCFKGVSNSYVPLIELPMDYYYDEAHIWPSEKLYRYIVKKYFANKKKYRDCDVSWYGAFSIG